MPGCGVWVSDSGGALHRLVFFAQRYSSIAQHGPGTPDLQQQEERTKGDQRADDIRKIWPQELRDRQLAQDVGQ